MQVGNPGVALSPLNDTWENGSTPRAFTKHAFGRHRRLLAELPENAQQRQNTIYNCNQMLAGTYAYTLILEKQRIQSHIADFVSMLQTAMAEHRMGDFDRRILKLATSGLPYQYIVM